MRVFGANEVPVVDRRAMRINLRSFKVGSDRKTNGGVPPPCMTEAPASAAPGMCKNRSPNDSRRLVAGRHGGFVGARMSVSRGKRTNEGVPDCVRDTEAGLDR